MTPEDKQQINSALIDLIADAASGGIQSLCNMLKSLTQEKAALVAEVADLLEALKTTRERRDEYLQLLAEETKTHEFQSFSATKQEDGSWVAEPVKSLEVPVQDQTGPKLDYTNFTERSRKVMNYANQEAQRFNYEYVTPATIFLGLIKEGSGVAHQVLENFGLDLNEARGAVTKLSPPGPDMVTMGKLPRDLSASVVLRHAIEQAKAMRDNHVGTEHILLGLLKDSESVPVKILTEGLKTTVAAVRAEVFRLLGQPDPEVAWEPGKLTYFAFYSEDSDAENERDWSGATPQRKRHWANKEARMQELFGKRLGDKEMKLSRRSLLAGAAASLALPAAAFGKLLPETTAERPTTDQYHKLLPHWRHNILSSEDLLAALLGKFPQPDGQHQFYIHTQKGFSYWLPEGYDLIVVGYPSEEGGHRVQLTRRYGGRAGLEVIAGPPVALHRLPQHSRFTEVVINLSPSLTERGYVTLGTSWGPEPFHEETMISHWTKGDEDIQKRLDRTWRYDHQGARNLSWSSLWKRR
jgi:hypothetical protein